jgi:hypothetical protein
MENVGIFYDHPEYFTAIQNNLWQFGICSLCSFGIFFPIWNVWTKKNLATLGLTRGSKNFPNRAQYWVRPGTFWHILPQHL